MRLDDYEISELANGDLRFGAPNLKWMAQEIQERRAKEAPQDTFWRNTFASSWVHDACKKGADPDALVMSCAAFNHAEAMLAESKRREKQEPSEGVKDYLKRYDPEEQP